LAVRWPCGLIEYGVLLERLRQRVRDIVREAAVAPVINVQKVERRHNIKERFQSELVFLKKQNKFGVRQTRM
jgi:hypothetical protein